MAIRYATKTGNWSDVTVWDGGTTKPTTGDTVVANTYTVTIDEDVDIGSGTIQTLAAGGGASGGGFTLPSGRSITANVLAGTTACVTCSAGNQTINGNCTGSATTSGIRAVNKATTGIVTINGNCTGGGASGTAHGVSLTSICEGAVITGNLLGGSGAGCGLGNTANVTSGIQINGTVTGGSGSSAHGFLSSSAIVTHIVVGNVFGGSGGADGINLGSGDTGVSITGNVTGGSHATSFGVITITQHITISGTVTGGSLGPGSVLVAS